MKWHLLVICFALNLKYMSTSAYRAVHQSGIISLLSQQTLSDCTHWVGISQQWCTEFIEHFRGPAQLSPVHLPSAVLAPKPGSSSRPKQKTKTGSVICRKYGQEGHYARGSAMPRHRWHLAAMGLNMGHILRRGGLCSRVILDSCQVLS